MHEMNPPLTHEKGWKSELESRFREWVEEQSELPETEGEGGDGDGGGGGGGSLEPGPSLYQFHEELCAMRGELRKGFRKSSETFSRFADSLVGFNDYLQDARTQLARLQAATSGEGSGSRRELLLPLTDLLARLGRIEGILKSPPRRRFALFGAGRWERYWRSLRDGYDILLRHYEQLLRTEGVIRIPALNAPFDPRVMVAIATEARPNLPDGQVIEELSPGFLYKDEVLRLAEVVVCRHPASTGSLNPPLLQSQAPARLPGE